MAEPRLATAADNEALLDLFASVPMEGDLVLSTLRAPDFFSLYRIQGCEAECWVQDAAAQPGLSGVGTVLVRDGWLDGRPQKVGYLGDLRAGPEAQRSRSVARFYGAVLDGLITRTGCEVFLTAVLASNQRALLALTRRRPARASQPYYHLLRRFSAVSVQLTRGRRSAPALRCRIRTAEAADVPALAAFLDRDHRGRICGYRFDAGELQRRLASWPAFSLGATYLAVDSEGAIAACASAWDPAAVKQYRVLAYRRGMRWAKLGWNVAAGLLGWPPLPPPGGVFRYFYLCNVSVRGEDPEIFRALLDRIYADHRSRGYHFFTLYLEDDDPLRPALRGLRARALPFHLYAVTSAGRPRTQFPAVRTGFEIALA
jgi:hypothetical protein